MSYFHDNGRNLLDDAWRNGARWVGLHSAYPSTTGANEFTGGGYIRQDLLTAIPSPASAGLAVSTVALNYSTVAATAKWFSFWTLQTSGLFLAASPLGGSLPAAATFSGSTFTSPGHGLSNGNRIVIGDVLVGGVPSGFTVGTDYFVVGAATDTFQLSATVGGSAISSADVREVIYATMVPQIMDGVQQLQLPVGQLVINGSPL